MNSYDIVEQAVREFWNNSIPEPVIAFFYQRYDNEKEWEWHEELITCTSSYDYETVVFEYDFCEGQTQVKNIKIVSLDEITTYYAKHHGLKRQNRERRESEDTGNE